MRAGPVAGHEILFQANSLEINILATLCPGEMRAGPVAGHEILFQANSLEINILATLCPGEDVDLTTYITFSIIIRICARIINYRLSRAADARYINFIPVVADYSITSQVLYAIRLSIIPRCLGICKVPYIDVIIIIRNSSMIIFDSAYFIPYGIPFFISLVVEIK